MLIADLFVTAKNLEKTGVCADAWLSQSVLYSTQRNSTPSSE